MLRPVAALLPRTMPLGLQSITSDSLLPKTLVHALKRKAQPFYANRSIRRDSCGMLSSSSTRSIAVTITGGPVT